MPPDVGGCLKPEPSCLFRSAVLCMEMSVVCVVRLVTITTQILNAQRPRLQRQNMEKSAELVGDCE